MFAALLDTNVLWPSLQRDFLLSLAAAGLYRPLWSEAILDELARHEEIKLRRRGVPDPEGKTAFLLDQLRVHFADAIVGGWEQLNPFGLPDPDDEHVLAAAVLGGAGVIVTENGKDFPAGAVPDGIEVRGAADFAGDTVSVDPDRALIALEELCRRRRRPAVLPTRALEVLESRYAMYEAVAMIRDVLQRPVS